MLEEKDKSAEEEKDTELKQLRGALADLSSSSMEKERKLLEEIETLRSKLSAKYSFLECGVKVKKVVVEDTDKVVNVDSVDATNDLALKGEEGAKTSKDEAKENILLRTEIERMKYEMATMAKAKVLDQGGSDHEKAEMEAKEMKLKGDLAEATLKVASLNK